MKTINKDGHPDAINWDEAVWMVMQYHGIDKRAAELWLSASVRAGRLRGTWINPATGRREPIVPDERLQ